MKSSLDLTIIDMAMVCTCGCKEGPGFQRSGLISALDGAVLDFNGKGVFTIINGSMSSLNELIFWCANYIWLKSAANKWPAQTKIRHKITDKSTLQPACKNSPSWSKNSVCKLNVENVV